MNIHPVILCGGSGNRLWPLSRQSFPKQFTQLVGSTTLFQASALRMSGKRFAAPLVITNSDFRFIVTEQLLEVGIDPGPILIEPEGRNTGPAVLAAALHLHQLDPQAVMLVVPSDHVIADVEAFHAAVSKGIAAAENGQIVTFGIKPTHAETAYGYLELAVEPNSGQVSLKGFVEKPSAERAAEMVAAGRFLWNAGIFLFSAKDIIAAFEAHAANLLEPVRSALKSGYADLGFFRLGEDAWSDVEDISVDYAVMEKATNLAVVPFDGGWSDLGGWDAVWREGDRDENANVTSGPITLIDCSKSMLRSESDQLEVVGLGLTDMIVVATPDAVLVADRSRAQEVKQAVNLLKAKGVKQATQFDIDHRPWGWFETLALADRFKVKRIVVKPGASLSLQSHNHRSEHWIVVSGTAKVTINDEVKLVTENQSVYVPLGAMHRMENPGKVPMVLIEVQTGSYLGEDDIIRYEDMYARG